MRAGLKTDFFDAPTPRAIAHRGGGGLAPENTMEAFAGAYRLGIRYFELDIHSSRDDVLVVCHDPDLKRTTDLTAAIRELYYDEIARADAGYRFAWQDQFPFRGKGVRVPRLTDVLAMFNDTLFIIEIKQISPSIAAALNETLSATGTRRRVLVASEHQQPLSEIRALAPELPTNFCTPEVLAFFGSLAIPGAAYQPPAEAVEIPPSHGSMVLATPTSVASAHQRGLEMHVWTVNEEAQMRELLEMGVDGIITDFPDRLQAILAQR
jgi:glycerophosphoryl diester phosphodiesterase